MRTERQPDTPSANEVQKSQKQVGNALPEYEKKAFSYFLDFPEHEKNKTDVPKKVWKKIIRDNFSQNNISVQK